MEKLGVYGLSPAVIPNEKLFFFQEFYGPIVYVSISLADQKLGLGARLVFLLVCSSAGVSVVKQLSEGSLR